MPAGQIAGHFEISRPAVSQHLSVLKEAGLVTERRNGTRRLYRARPRRAAGRARVSRRVLERPPRGAQARGRTRGEEHAWRASPRRLRSSASCRSRRARDGLGVPRRPGEGKALDGDRREARAGAGRALPRRGDPGHRRARHVRRGRSAAPARLHLGLGAEPDGETYDVAPGASTIEITLEPDGDGTHLRFEHRDLPSADSAGRHAHGWDHFLPRLVEAATGRDPGRDPVARRRDDVEDRTGRVRVPGTGTRPVGTRPFRSSGSAHCPPR